MPTSSNKRSERLKRSQETAESKGEQDGSSGVAGCPCLNRDWIEVALVGDDGEPVPDELCVITDPEGVEHVRKTDANGLIRADGIASGSTPTRGSPLRRASRTDG